VRKKINQHISENYFLLGREWPYKNVVPRIMAEKYMEDISSEILIVYKFFCFGGKPEIVQVISNDKSELECIDYFDLEWNVLNIRQSFPNSIQKPCKPGRFEEMIRISKKLSKNHPFIRVDLYEINDTVFFSEFTFYSDAGFARFEPMDWDLKLGDYIKIKNKICI